MVATPDPAVVAPKARQTYSTRVRDPLANPKRGICIFVDGEQPILKYDPAAPASQTSKDGAQMRRKGALRAGTARTTGRPGGPRHRGVGALQRLDAAFVRWAPWRGNHAAQSARWSLFRRLASSPSEESRRARFAGLRASRSPVSGQPSRIVVLSHRDLQRLPFAVPVRTICLAQSDRLFPGGWGQATFAHKSQPTDWEEQIPTAIHLMCYIRYIV